MPNEAPYKKAELDSIPHDDLLNEERLIATVRFLRDWSPLNEAEEAEFKRVGAEISTAILDRPFDRDQFTTILLEKFSQFFRRKAWTRTPAPVQEYVLHKAPKFQEEFYRRPFPLLPEEVAAAIFQRRPHLVLDYLAALSHSVLARATGGVIVADYEVVVTDDIAYTPIDKLLMYGSTIESMAKLYPEVKERIEDISRYIRRTAVDTPLHPDVTVKHTRTQELLNRLLTKLAKSYVRQQLSQKAATLCPTAALP